MQGKAVSIADGIYVHQDYVNFIKDAVFTILEAYYAKNPLLSAMPREELRSKLGDNTNYITTIHAYGYKFDVPKEKES